MPKLNKVKIDNGLYIDGTRINGITDVAINSNVDNFSEVTINFFCKVDGLDNVVDPNPYMFGVQEPKRPYKPSRKYRSR